MYVNVRIQTKLRLSSSVYGSIIKSHWFGLHVEERIAVEIVRKRPFFRRNTKLRYYDYYIYASLCAARCHLRMPGCKFCFVSWRRGIVIFYYQNNVKRFQ